MVELLTAVAAVIGAVAGLVNSWQIARLTGRVDSLWQIVAGVLSRAINALVRPGDSDRVLERIDHAGGRIRAAGLIARGGAL